MSSGFSPSLSSTRPSTFRGRVTLAISAIIVAIAVAFVVPAAASAATTGFEVTNFTSHPLYLQSVSEKSVSSKPSNGSTLQIGATVRIELTYKVLASSELTLNYREVEPSGSVSGRQIAVHMKQDAAVIVSADCSASGGSNLRCDTAGVSGTRVIGKVYQISVLDPPGTVVNVGPNDKQRATDALNRLCKTRNDASCTFTAHSQQFFLTPDHQVGSLIINNSDASATRTITISDTVTTSSSLGGTFNFTAGIKDVVSASISITYSRTYTDSHTFTEAITQTIPAHQTCNIVGAAPVVRFTGDFRIVFHNTTWNLLDVYIDQADLQGTPAYVLNCPAVAVQNPFERRLGLQATVGTSTVLSPTTSGLAAAKAPVKKLVRRNRLKLPATPKIVRAKLKVGIIPPVVEEPNVNTSYVVAVAPVAPAGSLRRLPGRADVVFNLAHRTLRESKHTSVRIPARVTFKEKIPAAQSTCVTAHATARNAKPGQATRCVRGI